MSDVEFDFSSAFSAADETTAATEKSVTLCAQTHPLVCSGPIEIPARASPATVARLVVAALFPDGLPSTLQGSNLSIERSSWRGEKSGTIQFNRQEPSFASYGAWWRDEIPDAVYDALYAWMNTLTPTGYKARGVDFHIPVDALADAPSVTLSEEAVSQYHAMLASASERHPDADSIMLERFYGTPRSLVGYEYNKGRYKIAITGLQRWLRDNRTWFNPAPSFRLALTPPGGRENAPRVGRKTKPTDYKDAATLRAEDGVERVYAESLVPIVVTSDLFYEPQRFMATRAEVAAILREVSLLDQRCRPSVDLVEISDWQEDQKIYGRQTYVRGKDFRMTPLLIEEVALDDKKGAASPWYGAPLDSIVANPEIERLARSDWSRTVRSGGHVLIDSASKSSFAFISAMRAGCVAEIRPINRPWISYLYGFATLAEAKEACIRGLVSVGYGQWFGSDNFSEHFKERGVPTSA